MLIGVPENTSYDWRFHLLGVPVRVHPLFWLVTVMLGANGRGENPSSILIWVACVFVSILVHEFGHAGMAWLFGARPSIVLYGMGGLCYYPEADRETHWQRIAVLLSGPGAGFVLFGLTFGLYIAKGQPPLSPFTREVFNDLCWINLGWGIINLLPVWPMDGGQITSSFLCLLNRRNGRRWAHILSIFCGIVLALLMVKFHQNWMAFLFGYFAFVNYQMLQAIQYTRSHLDDDADWWKR